MKKLVNVARGYVFRSTNTHFHHLNRKKLATSSFLLTLKAKSDYLATKHWDGATSPWHHRPVVHETSILTSQRPLQTTGRLLHHLEKGVQTISRNRRAETEQGGSTLRPVQENRYRQWIEERMRCFRFGNLYFAPFKNVTRFASNDWDQLSGKDNVLGRYPTCPSRRTNQHSPLQ